MEEVFVIQPGFSDRTSRCSRSDRTSECSSTASNQYSGRTSRSERQNSKQVEVVPGVSVIIPGNGCAALTYLSSLGQVIVQKLHVYDNINSYSINNSFRQTFLLAKEDTTKNVKSCCYRWLQTVSYRPFVMEIFDNTSSVPLMKLMRPLRCKPWWCCCLQEMTIESPPGNLRATVRQKWSFWNPLYGVYDASNMLIFTIKGVCYRSHFCCGDVIFSIYDGNNVGRGKDIGHIIQHWGGCAELCSGGNIFTIDFPPNINQTTKTILLGSAFLIDFNHFEMGC